MVDPNQNVHPRRSPIWADYDAQLVTEEDGLAELFAKCKRCSKKLLVAKNGGTGNLMRHEMAHVKANEAAGARQE